jgi:hypothetical protein
MFYFSLAPTVKQRLIELHLGYSKIETGSDMILGLPRFEQHDKQIIQEVMKWFPQRIGQELVPNSRNTTEGNGETDDITDEEYRIIERRRQAFDEVEQEKAEQIWETQMRSVHRRLQERDIKNLKKEQAKQK